MLGKLDMWSLLCRGRKKKITFLILTLIILFNAMVYVSVELYNTIKKKHADPWYNQLRFGNNSYLDDSGMRVIVGHYIGGSKGGKLTDDMIHGNFYSPMPGAGEWGRPVQLSPRELITAQEWFSLHSYNILVGDRIPIDRKLPEMRSPSCQAIKYDLESLPTASVVIVFHNEAWSTLMRTVMSVLLRSPESLLKQIILVDDASDRRYLGRELEEGVEKLEKVQILRLKERSGLVGARLMGAKAAVGDVLVFLDAHCEVTSGWLEPLLDRAGSDDVFICPHIDLLSEDTLAYTKSVDAHWGAFSWQLHFRWLMPSADVIRNKSKNPARPYATPAMAGGLFAVSRSLFWRIGGYDAGMKIWGGENLELSWRAWQCGARVEITSCSRVGHIFRRHSPYKYPGGVAKVLNSNLARAATVWMDEWADFFFKFNPSIARIRDEQHVADRIKLRQDLGCKSFQWYLDTVWPQHFFPTDKRWFGRVRNELGACLAVPSSSSPGLGGPARGIACGADLESDKLIVFTPEGQIMADEGLCLEAANKGVVWKGCSDNSKQIWAQKGPRLAMNTTCLTLPAVNSGDGVDDPLKLWKCGGKGQIWHFERVPWR